MKQFVAVLLLPLIACGGGGESSGGSGTTPPPVFIPPTPIPSAFFEDVSDNLPASRTRDCFDAQVVDIDADNDLDLVLAILNGPNLVYINDGTGRFSDESTTRLPSVSDGLSEHVAVRDLNGDGSPDLVFANVVNNGAPTNEYYLNDGNGNFNFAPQSLSVDGLSSFIAAHDFDNDGDQDLFLSNFGQNNLLINDGSGAFTNETNTRLPSDNALTEDSAIGDINGDGFLDILISNRGTGVGQGRQNIALLNDGMGFFTDETSIRLPTINNSTFDSILGDLNGDGFIDLVLANATVAEAGTPLLDNVYLNDGVGNFIDQTASQWPQTDLSNTFGVTLADIDRDNDLDILLAEWAYDGNNGLGKFRAYANDGTGQFVDQTITLLGDVRGNGVDIVKADFNGDGLVDLYFCAASQNQMGAAQGASDFLFLGQ